MEGRSSFFRKTLVFSIFLALLVIVLGAYTRISDAGLGCPDWPGCYGELSVPSTINTSFERPLESAKAWKEMIHRYAASTLGLMILLILVMVLKNKPTIRQSIFLPLLLLSTVIFQALLGMWTVTMLLSPLIVTAHLVGGFTTLSILWWLYLNQTNGARSYQLHSQVSSLHRGAIIVALLLIILQILLGGWTSTNYAALACGTDFPTCLSLWWPEMDFSRAFEFSHKSGVDYEFGILESSARTAIQYSHRLGALTVFIYLSILGINLILKKNSYRLIGVVLLFLLFCQVTLGVLNVILGLPVVIAVSHNLVAAFLLLTVITITHRTIR